MKNLRLMEGNLSCRVEWTWTHIFTLITILFAYCHLSLCQSSPTAATSGAVGHFAVWGYREMPLQLFQLFPREGSSLLLDVRTYLAPCFVWKGGLQKRNWRLGSFIGSLPSGRSAIWCTSSQPLDLKPYAWVAALSFLFPMTSSCHTCPAF